MSGVSGVEYKLAIKKAATWATAVACGAGDGLLFLPDSLKQTREEKPDDSLGNYWAADSDSGAISASGDTPHYLRYDGLDLLFALLCGSTAGVPTQQSSTTAYAQSFPFTTNRDGLFATIALNQKVNIKEVASAKLIGATLSGEVGQPVKLTCNWLLTSISKSSLVNTLTTFNNVTIPEIANRVLFNQGVFRINSQSGAALTDSDKVYPKSFDLAVKLPMEGVYGAGGSFDIIDEPTNNGLPEVTLNLKFPRYSAVTNFTDWNSKVLKKLDITFTGNLIASTFYRTFKLQFPNMKISNVEDATENGIIPEEVEFKCLACATAPTGMTGIVKPFLLSVINQKSTNVLA
jgi:hypothetical protein